MKRLLHLIISDVILSLVIAISVNAQKDDNVIQKYLDNYIKTGDPQIVEKIRQVAPDSKYYRFCEAYDYLDIDNEKGLLLSRKLVKDFPDFAEANFALGTFMINVANHYDSAIYYLDRVIESKPDFAAAVFNRGIGEINLKFFEAAKSDFSKVIETDSTHAGAYLMRAVSEFMLKDYSSMLPDMQIALRIDPDILSDFYFLQVRKTVDKCIELKPENVSFIVARGYANYKSGYFRLAVNDFAVALNLASMNSEYYKMMGVCRIYLNDTIRAESDLKIALDINPGDAEIFYYLGLYANNLLGQPEKSIEYLNKAIELDALNPLYYYQRALILYNLYKYKATLSDIDKAIELDTHNGDYYCLRALAALDGNLKTDWDYCKDFRTAEELGTSYEVEKYIITFCANK